MFNNECFDHFSLTHKYTEKKKISNHIIYKTFVSDCFLPVCAHLWGGTTSRLTVNPLKIKQTKVALDEVRDDTFDLTRGRDRGMEVTTGALTSRQQKYPEALTRLMCGIMWPPTPPQPARAQY